MGYSPRALGPAKMASKPTGTTTTITEARNLVHDAFTTTVPKMASPSISLYDRLTHNCFSCDRVIGASNIAIPAPCMHGIYHHSCLLGSVNGDLQSQALLDHQGKIARGAMDFKPPSCPICNRDIREIWAEGQEL